jgi:hypothetical protein
MNEHVSLIKCLTNVSCLCAVGKDEFFALADGNDYCKDFLKENVL